MSFDLHSDREVWFTPIWEYSQEASMTMLEFVKARLQGRTQAEWRAVGDATGVPYSTIEKIVYGLTTDPRVSSVEPLYRYLSDEARVS